MKKPFLLSRAAWCALALILGACLDPLAARAAGYTLVKKIPLPGDGGWDYLAADTSWLFVTHGDRVQVIDLVNLEPAREITPLAGVHGVALAPGLGRGFISNGKTDVITVFDLRKLTIRGQWPAGGKKPDAILFDPATQRVCSFNGGSDNVTVFNAATGQLLGTLALGGKPEFAASDGTGQVFVNIEDKGETVRFDARTLAITARWALAPAHTPTALAYDVTHHRLLVGCRSQHLVVLNSDTGSIVATLPIGAGVDAVSYLPGRGLVVVSNSDGTLNIIKQTDADHYALVETVTTVPGARTHAVDGASGRIFVSSAQFEPAPPAAPGQPQARPAVVPGSFSVFVYQQ